MMLMRRRRRVLELVFGLEFYVSTEICKCNGKIFCNNSILMNYVFAIFEIIFERKITQKLFVKKKFKIMSKQTQKCYDQRKVAWHVSVKTGRKFVANF